MRIESFLCMGGVEVSNGYRVARYVENVGVPGVTMGSDCQCPQLDDGFDTPLNDPAPWYEATRPESADFLGLWLTEPRLQPVMSRSVNGSGHRGSTLGSLTMKGRILQAQGLMVAKSGEGMAYGESWIAETLRGSRCEDCSGDDLIILPACPEMETYDVDRYYRTLVNVGVVDGPVFAPVISKEYVTQQASFVLTSEQPWLYHPATRCLNGVNISGTLSCALTTPEWMGEGTFRIELENTGTTNSTDIVVTGRISLNGSCPVSGTGTSVPPSFVYTVPELKPEDKLVIDGARRRVKLYDASEKYVSPGLKFVDFDGPWKWPDVGPCTTMCLSVTKGGGGNAKATVDTYLREL